MKNHNMYRAESFEGSGYRDPVSVLTYEFCELGNADAIYYITEQYLSDCPDLTAEAERLCSLCYKTQPQTDEVSSFFNSTLSKIKRKTGIQINAVLWLAPLNTVIDFYSDDISNINNYDTAGGIVLSRLDMGEVLWGFDTLPEPKWFDPDILNKAEKRNFYG